MYFVRDTSVTDAQEWYFDPSSGGEIPRYGTYKDVRIVGLWTAAFSVASDITYLGTHLAPLQDAIFYHHHRPLHLLPPGGQLSFTLPVNVRWPAGLDPVANNWITWSADKVPRFP